MDQRHASPYRLFRFAGLVAFFACACLPLHAQVYEPDNTFHHAFGSEDVTPAFLERNDGSLWVTGVAFVDGAPVQGIVRFRADGSMDTPVSLPFPSDVNLEMVEADGATIVLGGSQLLRLLPDGGVDPNYQPPTIWNGALGKLHPSFDGGVLVPTTALRLADGTIFPRKAFARLHADGALDAAFPDLDYRVRGVDDEGRLYAVANNRVKRFLATGLPDPAWTEVELAGPILQFLVHPDGGGIARRSTTFDRLDSTGAKDPTFAVQAEDVGWAAFDDALVRFLPDGRMILLLSTARYSSDEPTLAYVVRVEANGQIDETFAPPETIGRGFGFWGERPLVRFRDADARPRFAGRLLADGQLDPAWRPRFGRRGSLTAVRADVEGRILVAGYFDFVDGEARPGIVRFLADGILDSSFVPQANAPNAYYGTGNGYDHIRVGRDGSVFLYTVVHSSPSSPDSAVVTRLTASGALHPDQVPPLTGGHDASATADGSLYYTRPYSYATPGGSGGTYGFDLVRRAPGSVSDTVLTVEFRETIFTTPGAYQSRALHGSPMEVLADGRILVTTGLRSAPNGSAIVAADGSQATPLPDSVGLQSDFPLYAQATIYRTNGAAQLTVRRITSAGTLDTGFEPPAVPEHLTFLTDDDRGGAVVWRWEDSMTMGEVVRLRGDGSLDTGLSHPGTNITAAATAADRSLFLLSYSNLERLTLETRETVALELVTPSLVAGRTAILAAGVGVPGDVTWRWQRDGVDVPGATGPTLTLEPARLTDSGTYRAFATVDGLVLVSEAINLAVQAPHARLVNLSARTLVSAAESQQIAGFVLAHPAQLVVRGVGPSLGPLGVQQPLASPEIVLRDADSDEVARNAGWGGESDLQAAFARVLAFPLPTDSADAALVAALPAGLYTASISGSADGIGLAELYLDSSASTAPLINLSIRARVGTGEATVIAGFVVEGEGPQRLLIRAVGQSLLTHGVADPMADPSFSIHHDDVIVLTNDEATSEALAAEAESDAFPLTPGVGDAADVVYLEPGRYTVLVSGDTGIVLVEIYALPPI